MMQKMNWKKSRNSTTTIVRQEWIEDDVIAWLTVWTNDLVRPFRLVGIPLVDYNRGYRHEWESEFAVGNIVRLGDLHAIPNTIWMWLANIQPGVNIQIASVDDGLIQECGPLLLCRILDTVNSGIQMTPTQHAVAMRAVLSNDRDEARSILEQSGMFGKVYEFDQAGYFLDMCFEP